MPPVRSSRRSRSRGSITPATKHKHTKTQKAAYTQAFPLLNLVQSKLHKTHKTVRPGQQKAVTFILANAKELLKMAKEKAKDSQSNKFQLTINNPTAHGLNHEKIKKVLTNDFSTAVYSCMADEKGETYHTHLLICFSSRVRFSKVKKHFPPAHIEIVRGTVTDNVNYIKKSGKWENDEKHGTQIEGTFEEWGVRPPDSTGKNSDMTDLYQLVKEGLSNADIIALNQDYILHIDKLDKLRTTLLIDENKRNRRLDLRVTYIYGKTGTGKTRGVLDEFGDENVYRVTDYDHPFDGYECQSVILFDEFRSSLPIKDMLNYLDIYPIQLPARYANKFACYQKVFIISNWKLEDQYSELQKHDKESWQAFLRRIHQVKVYNDVNDIVMYDTIADYLKHDSWEKIDEKAEKEVEQVFEQTTIPGTEVPHQLLE